MGWQISKARSLQSLKNPKIGACWRNPRFCSSQFVGKPQLGHNYLVGQPKICEIIHPQKNAYDEQIQQRKETSTSHQDFFAYNSVYPIARRPVLQEMGFYCHYTHGLMTLCQSGRKHNSEVLQKLSTLWFRYTAYNPVCTQSTSSLQKLSTNYTYTIIHLYKQKDGSLNQVYYTHPSGNQVSVKNMHRAAKAIFYIIFLRASIILL